MWRLTIEKMYQAEYWTNVYWLDADVSVASSAAQSILAAERAITLNDVLFTKMRLDDALVGTDVYTTTVLNVFGQSTANAATKLPLFNVLRVDFAAAQGRPSRKYLRGVLTEDVISFNTIAPATLTFYDTNYSTPVANVAGFLDVDEQEIISGAAVPFVGMRQLRRGSKKPVTP